MSINGFGLHELCTAIPTIRKKKYVFIYRNIAYNAEVKVNFELGHKKTAPQIAQIDCMLYERKASDCKCPAFKKKNPKLYTVLKHTESANSTKSLSIRPLDVIKCRIAAKQKN